MDQAVFKATGRRKRSVAQVKMVPGQGKITINEREIAGAIALARAGHVDILAVGNEVLLR